MCQHKNITEITVFNPFQPRLKPVIRRRKTISPEGWLRSQAITLPRQTLVKPALLNCSAHSIWRPGRQARGAASMRRGRSQPLTMRLDRIHEKR